MAENQPIIIKKVKKGGHGHHGGAWKLAYADFVTAMMAFFLLMWLLGTTDPAVRQGIAEYFKDPWKPSMAGGANTGDATSIIKGGGEDLTQSEGQVKLTNRGKEDITADSSEAESDADREKTEKQEAQALEGLKEKIEAMMETNPLLKQFESQLKIDITEEGLRIQIIDEEGRPMFQSASARMEPYAADILHQIAPVINELPNKISVAGHTDAKPFPGTGQGYSNWELSSDRANAARKELIKGGLKEDKMMRVVGLSSSAPYVANDPFHATNRRISIIVMNSKAVEEISGGGDVKVSAGKPFNKDSLGEVKPVAPKPPSPSGGQSIAPNIVPPKPPLPAPKKGIDAAEIPGTMTGKKLTDPTVIPGTLTAKKAAEPGGTPPPAANAAPAEPGRIPGTLTGRRAAPTAPPPAAPAAPAAEPATPAAH